MGKTWRIFLYVDVQEDDIKCLRNIRWYRKGTDKNERTKVRSSSTNTQRCFIIYFFFCCFSSCFVYPILFLSNMLCMCVFFCCTVCRWMYIRHVVCAMGMDVGMVYVLLLFWWKCLSKWVCFMFLFGIHITFNLLFFFSKRKI